MKLVAYIRVSSKSQENNTSFDSQLSRIQAYCQYHGHTIVQIFKEVQSGSRASNRKQLQAAITILNNNQADGLIVAKLDRLGRRSSDITGLIDNVLAPIGKELIITDLGLDTGSMIGKMVVTVLSAAAEMELTGIKERTSSGKRERKAKDGNVGGAPKFGEQVTEKKLVVNDDEQKVIEIIRRHHKAGKSQRAIADYLNKQGIKSKRGGTWSSTTVGRVLDRLYPKATKAAA